MLAITRDQDRSEETIRNARRRDALHAVAVTALAVVVALGSAAHGRAQEAEPPSQEGAAATGPGAEGENPPIGGVDLETIRKAVKGSWEGMVERWLTPIPVPRKTVVFLEDGYALSHPAVSFKMKVVREEGDTVWLQGLPPENPESPLHPLWLRRQRDELLMRGVQDYTDIHGEPYYFLDFTKEVIPSPFVDALDFEPTSEELPDKGRWQMSFAVADMNGDGIDDLVHPPQRAGSARPFIFLGDGDGGFEPWDGQLYSRQVPFDYGGIAVADFDGDGHQDIALAIHFKSQWVMYGDGTGDFTRVVRLQSPDPRITSRAVTAADFDLDGRTDLAFLAELDLDLGTNQRIEGSPTVWLARNGETGWTPVKEGMPRGFIGDMIHAADVDGDGRPDIVAASNTNHHRELLFLNREDEGFVSPGKRLVLANSYHFDVEPVTEPDGTVAVYAVFTQFLKVLDDNQARTGLIRYVLGDEGLHAPDGAIVFDDARYDPYYRLAVGDLNGDGRVDLVAGRKTGGLEVYLQMASGEFYVETAPELAETGRPYDLQLHDVDGDGRDDIIGCFAETDDHPGGVSVWASRPRS